MGRLDVAAMLEALPEEPPTRPVGGAEPAVVETDVAPEPMELADLLALEMPPRSWIVEGLIQDRDIVMLHGWRGLGKTRVTHGLAIAVASGGSFLKWSCPVARPVLLVDGELPREDLQRMFAQAAAAGCQSSASLRVLSADLCGGPIRSLATPEGRRRIEDHLRPGDLLIIDSITTLCPGAGAENDAESWEPIQAWLLHLRGIGVTTLLVHHDGKGGSQRGTSKREDILSLAIQLKRPKDYHPSEGCRVELHFTKARALRGSDVDTIEARLVTSPEGQPAWTCRPAGDEKKQLIHRLSNEGHTQRDIAQQVGTSAATVNRTLKKGGDR